MVKARYYKADGSKGRARELPGDLFDGVVNESVLHQAVKAYLANQRQGTAAAKNRAAVRGGSRKPWRQKGTGRARQGTIRAPQWTGGGLAFPPQPHSWRQRLPRKVRQLARRSALNARAAGEQVLVVDAFEFETPRTKQLVDFLAEIGVQGKVLILTGGARENLLLSARNLSDVRVLPFGEESAYDVLYAGTILIERPAVDRAVKLAGEQLESAADDSAELADEAEETTDA